jgi:NADPH:quinone reductase-like Zn-dependent oxidoreductase
MVAGIDLAGTVVESRVPEWKPGDKVVANGFGMSETEWGGYARYARLKSEWLVPLPNAFSLEDAMAIGTAGYTAALCVDALEDWKTIVSRKGDIVVTGLRVVSALSLSVCSPIKVTRLWHRPGAPRLMTI